MSYTHPPIDDARGDAREIHVNTVARDLRLAEAWLRRQLRAET